MIQTLLLIIPFGLAGAVSPMMLTEQTMLLATGGQAAGKRYALGAATAALVFATVLIIFGQAISLPQEPRLDAGLDITIGLFLFGLALFLRKPRIHREKKPKERKASFGAASAFGFGVFSMTTNFTTLALMVPAAKAIAVSELEFPLRAMLVVVLVGLVSTPAWLPVALTGVAPGPAERSLTGIGSLIQKRGRLLTVLLLAGLGLLLVVRGAFAVG